MSQLQTHPILTQLDKGIVRSGDDIGLHHQGDWSLAPATLPPVLLLPRNTDEVSQILKLCQFHTQPLVTQGGLTGLSGGATPKQGEWALSLEKMQSIDELDTESLTITVGAGTPLETIQNAAEDAGLVLPLDLGSRGSCTAGGVAATNAGGNQVIQRGMARALILGMEAVQADGTIINSSNKLLKNNAGFDLKQLFIGSEGTLGVITSVTFRLFPKRNICQTALCTCDKFSDVISLLKEAQRNLTGLKAFEVMWSSYFHPSLEATSSRDPFSEKHNYYVLCETEGTDAKITTEEFESTLASAMEKGWVQDAVLAQNEKEAITLWTIRDGVTELVPIMMPGVNFDVGVPIPLMERFSIDAEKALKENLKDCAVYLFGHIGDGNLHLMASTGNEKDLEPIEEIVFDLVRKAKGTITAEHGIGTLKKAWLHYSRTPEELHLMQQLKRMMDPANILNPGRVIDC